MSKRLALIVEDNPGMQFSLVQAAKVAGFDVLPCGNGIEAQKLWWERHPDLVLLDLALPGRSGKDLLFDWVLQQNDLPQTCIVVISEYAELRAQIMPLNFEFWDKPVNYPELIERVKDLANRIPSYRKLPWEHLWEISITPGEQIHFMVNGGNPATSSEAVGLDCDLTRYKLEAYMMHPRWLRLVQDFGSELYKTLLSQGYSEAMGSCRKPENLRLRFTIPEACAGAGYELVYNKIQKTFLALQHPVSCRLSNVYSQPNTGGLNRDRLNRRKDSLRVLLIAGNIAGEESQLPSINVIDQEVEDLAIHIPQWFRERSVSCEKPALIRSSEATLQTLKNKLDQSYDIVHFAGHATHDDDPGNESGIYLWSSGERTRREWLCPVGELEEIFRRHCPRFVFLNACSSGAHAGQEAFYRGRFLGLTHCLLKAGIHSVLGYRGPVSASHASKLALAFYKALADEGELDLALLEARKHLERSDPQDAIYLSSVLYMQ